MEFEKELEKKLKQNGYDFRLAVEEIKDIVHELSEEDCMWDWSLYDVREKEIMLSWKYLYFVEDKDVSFRIVREEGEYLVYDVNGDFISPELEDETTLYTTMRSIFWYANSRY